MRVHIVYDLANQSTKDVADGLIDGIRSLGHGVSFSPVNAYTHHMLEGFSADSEVPPQHWMTIHAVINKIVMGDLCLHGPDLMLVISGWSVASQTVEVARRLGIRSMIYLTESPYCDEKQTGIVGPYDHVLCNEFTSMKAIAVYNDNTGYMPHSYNPEVHKPTPLVGEVDLPEVYFCGTGFSERMEILSLCDWRDVKLQLQGFYPRSDEYGLTPYVDNRVIPNSALPAMYSNVPINLNIHRTTKVWNQNAGDEEHIKYAESIGPRVYEVLACGGFLLTDHRKEMDGFLEDGVHLATFRDQGELKGKVRYYLAHPKERERIASNGRQAVIDCTFSSRVQKFLLPQLIQASEGVKCNG